MLILCICSCLHSFITLTLYGNQNQEGESYRADQIRFLWPIRLPSIGLYECISIEQWCVAIVVVNIFNVLLSPDNSLKTLCIFMLMFHVVGTRWNPSVHQSFIHLSLSTHHLWPSWVAKLPVTENSVVYFWNLIGVRLINCSSQWERTRGC